MERGRVGPGQESVWDYPRPPRHERTDRRIEVVFAGATLARTDRALRVLETSHPPVYYLPPEDVREGCLRPSARTSLCEWKGVARYLDVVVGERVERDAAWYYPEPLPPYREMAGHVAFYPSRMDACLVDGERAEAQEGDFYGGWITSDVVGPFKGAPGTRGW